MSVSRVPSLILKDGLEHVRFPSQGGVAGRLLIVIVAVILTIGSGRVAMAAEPQLRGIWMHANFIRTLR